MSRRDRSPHPPRLAPLRPLSSPPRRMVSTSSAPLASSLSSPPDGVDVLGTSCVLSLLPAGWRLHPRHPLRALAPLPAGWRLRPRSRGACGQTESPVRSVRHPASAEVATCVDRGQSVHPIRPSRGACEISRPAPAQGKNAEGAVPIGTAPSVYRMIVQILTFTALPSGVRTM